MRRAGTPSVAACLGAATLFTACASAPRVDGIATVAVYGTVTPGDLEAGHTQALRVRKALQAAGIGRDEVAAGRVVRVACAMMTDGTWGSVGLLPAGVRAANESVWRMRVRDAGDDDRDGVNPILEPVPDLTWSGRAAYAFVSNWRELGRSSNLDRVHLPPDQTGNYHIVHSRYLVRCRT